MADELVLVNGVFYPKGTEPKDKKDAKKEEKKE